MSRPKFTRTKLTEPKLIIEQLHIIKGLLETEYPLLPLGADIPAMVANKNIRKELLAAREEFERMMYEVGQEIDRRKKVDEHRRLKPTELDFLDEKGLIAEALGEVLQTEETFNSILVDYTDAIKDYKSARAKLTTAAGDSEGSSVKANKINYTPKNVKDVEDTLDEVPRTKAKKREKEETSSNSSGGDNTGIAKKHRDLAKTIEHLVEVTPTKRNADKGVTLVNKTLRAMLADQHMEQRVRHPDVLQMWHRFKEGTAFQSVREAFGGSVLIARQGDSLESRDSLVKAVKEVWRWVCACLDARDGPASRVEAVIRGYETVDGKHDSDATLCNLRLRSLYGRDLQQLPTPQRYGGPQPYAEPPRPTQLQSGQQAHQNGGYGQGQYARTPYIPKVCWTCNQPGHVSHQCPNRVNPQMGLNPTQQNSMQQSPMNGGGYNPKAAGNNLPPQYSSYLRGLDF